MRIFDRSTAAATQVGVVDVQRFEQYGLGATMPFEAMWYSVPPGGTSPRDSHPELELSVVLSGTARVEVDGVPHVVAAGSSFLLDADESHVVTNLDERTDLVIFSAYWMPVAAACPTAELVDAGV